MHSHAQGGFSLMEVLVALVILTTGILGTVAMQLTAKRGSYGALERTQAVNLANDLLERVRSNPSELANYAANYGSGQTVSAADKCSSSSYCSPAALRQWDQFQWHQQLMGADTKENTQNVAVLGNAVGCVTVSANAITVVVSWQGIHGIGDADAASSCGTASDKRRLVSVSSVIL
ncbi:type IV pilus modification protein PilV [Gallaecimonas sp. GXIMD4217]|uniref:type IV pilus modification protein PilV n=1 Tax=Gallaecimonas sp. GXIMD4217 TaxID=3131927 RepID=UPI00311B2735